MARRNSRRKRSSTRSSKKRSPRSRIRRLYRPQPAQVDDLIFEVIRPPQRNYYRSSSQQERAPLSPLIPRTAPRVELTEERLVKLLTPYILAAYVNKEPESIMRRQEIDTERFLVLLFLICTCRIAKQFQTSTGDKTQNVILEVLTDETDLISGFTEIQKFVEYELASNAADQLGELQRRITWESLLFDDEETWMGIGAIVFELANRTREQQAPPSFEIYEDE